MPRHVLLLCVPRLLLERMGASPVAHGRSKGLSKSHAEVRGGPESRELGELSNWNGRRCEKIFHGFQLHPDEFGLNTSSENALVSVFEHTGGDVEHLRQFGHGEALRGGESDAFVDGVDKVHGPRRVLCGHPLVNRLDSIGLEYRLRRFSVTDEVVEKFCGPIPGLHEARFDAGQGRRAVLADCDFIVDTDNAKLARNLELCPLAGHQNRLAYEIHVDENATWFWKVA